MKHKHLLLKLLFLILLSLTTFLIYNKNNKNNITYLSLGDGFAQGINQYGIKEYGYSDYLKDYLKEKNKLKDYINISNKQMSIKELINTIINNNKVAYKNNKSNLKQILRESDIITISIGLNDIMYYDNLNSQIISKQNISKYIIKDYKDLIKEIKKYYPHKIIFIGHNKKTNPVISEINYFLSTNKDIIYINTTNLNNSNLLKSNPSIYYNRSNYQEISGKIIKKLNKNLKKQ